MCSAASTSVKVFVRPEHSSNALQSQPLSKRTVVNARVCSIDDFAHLLKQPDDLLEASSRIAAIGCGFPIGSAHAEQVGSVARFSSQPRVGLAPTLFPHARSRPSSSRAITLIKKQQDAPGCHSRSAPSIVYARQREEVLGREQDGESAESKSSDCDTCNIV